MPIPTHFRLNLTRFACAVREFCGGKGGKPGRCPDLSKSKAKLDVLHGRMTKTVERAKTARPGKRALAANVAAHKARSAHGQHAAKHQAAVELHAKHEAHLAAKGAKKAPAATPAFDRNTYGRVLAHTQEAARGFSSAEKGAIHDYTAGLNEVTSAALRRGEMPADREARDLVRNLDGAFAKTPALAKPVLAYRGLAFHDPQAAAAVVADLDGRLKGGKPLALGDYQSTSLDPERAHEFLAGHGKATDGVMIEVEARHGLGVEDLSKAKQAKQEREFLLPRGGNYEVVSKGEREINGRKVPVYRLRQQDPAAPAPNVAAHGQYEAIKADLPNLSVAEIRGRAAELASHSKAALAGVLTKLGYTADGSKADMAAKLLDNLTSLKVSHEQTKQIREQAPPVASAPRAAGAKPAPATPNAHVARAKQLAATVDPNSKWHGAVAAHVHGLEKLPKEHLTAIAQGLGHTAPLARKEDALMAIQDRIGERIKRRRDDPTRLLSESACGVREFCGKADCGKPGCTGCKKKFAAAPEAPAATPAPQPEPLKLATCKGVEIFATGLHRSHEYTESDLDRIVANFDRLSSPTLPKRLLTPTIVLGHEEDDDPDKFWASMSTGIPSVGIPSRLWREGKKLMADFGDVLPLVARAVNSRAYRKCSAELYDDFENEGTHYGIALRRVALLGGELPQVKSLEDLPLSQFRERPKAKLLYVFSEVRPMSRVFQGPDGKWYWPRTAKFAECDKGKKVEEFCGGKGGKPGRCPDLTKSKAKLDALHGRMTAAQTKAKGARPGRQAVAANVAAHKARSAHGQHAAKHQAAVELHAKHEAHLAAKGAKKPIAPKVVEAERTPASHHLDAAKAAQTRAAQSGAAAALAIGRAKEAGAAGRMDDFIAHSGAALQHHDDAARHIAAADVHLKAAAASKHSDRPRKFCGGAGGKPGPCPGGGTAPAGSVHARLAPALRQGTQKAVAATGATVKAVGRAAGKVAGAVPAAAAAAAGGVRRGWGLLKGIASVGGRAIGAVGGAARKVIGTVAGGVAGGVNAANKSIQKRGVGGALGHAATRIAERSLESVARAPGGVVRGAIGAGRGAVRAAGGAVTGAVGAVNRANKRLGVGGGSRAKQHYTEPRRFDDDDGSDNSYYPSTPQGGLGGVAADTQLPSQGGFLAGSPGQGSEDSGGLNTGSQDSGGGDWGSTKAGGSGGSDYREQGRLRKHCQQTRKPGPCAGQKRGTGRGIVGKVAAAAGRGLKKAAGWVVTKLPGAHEIAEELRTHEQQHGPYLPGQAPSKKKAVAKGVGKKVAKSAAEYVSGILSPTGPVSPDLVKEVAKRHGSKKAGAVAGTLYGLLNKAAGPVAAIAAVHALGPLGLLAAPAGRALASTAIYHGIKHGAAFAVPAARVAAVAGKAIGKAGAAVGRVAGKVGAAYGSNVGKVASRTLESIGRNHPRVEKGIRATGKVLGKAAGKAGAAAAVAGKAIGKAGGATGRTIGRGLAAGGRLANSITEAVNRVAPKVIEGGIGIAGGALAGAGRAIGGVAKGAGQFLTGHPVRAVKKVAGGVGGFFRGIGSGVGKGLKAARGAVGLSEFAEHSLAWHEAAIRRSLVRHFAECRPKSTRPPPRRRATVRR